jgi:hypothetical protein
MPAQPLQHIISQQQQNKQHTQPHIATHKKEQEDTGINMKGQWPPKLKAYVERTFEKCQEEAERVEMEGELKKVITKAIQENTLWTIDWDREPIIT